MGAWGYGIFDNDTALDWVGALEPTKGTDFLHKTLDAVPDKVGGPDADVCSNGLAAAEVVAALKGAPSESLAEEASAWVKANSEAPTPELIAKAQRACRLIKTDSELRDLWDEVEELATWLAAVEDIERRLA